MYVYYYLILSRDLKEIDSILKRSFSPIFIAELKYLKQALIIQQNNLKQISLN